MIRPLMLEVSWCKWEISETNSTVIIFINKINNWSNINADKKYKNKKKTDEKKWCNRKGDIKVKK